MTDQEIEKWIHDHADDPKEVAFWEAYKKQQQRDRNGDHRASILELVDKGKNRS